MIDVVIVGAGGHGRELHSTIVAANSVQERFRVLGFVADDPTHLDRLERLGLTVLGDVEWLCSAPMPYALGIGTGAVRRSLDERLTAAGASAVSVVHPGASIGQDVRLGEGVVIYDRSTVTTNVAIGRHTHLNVGCAVQHDSVIGDFVQFSPGVFVNGDCMIGDEVFLGTGAIVTRGLTVGASARVGAGAVVLSDIGSGQLVVGAPARPPRHS